MAKWIYTWSKNFLRISIGLWERFTLSVGKLSNYQQTEPTLRILNKCLDIQQRKKNNEQISFCGKLTGREVIVSNFHQFFYRVLFLTYTEQRTQNVEGLVVQLLGLTQWFYTRKVPNFSSILVFSLLVLSPKYSSAVPHLTVYWVLRPSHFMRHPNFFSLSQKNVTLLKLETIWL